MTVFAVITHGDPGTFSLLVDALAPHAVVAHVDARTDTSSYPRAPHLSYTATRHPVAWAGFSMVEATLTLYGEAVAQTRSPNEHIVLLSGQCLPLRPIRELDAYLASAVPRQHINAGRILGGPERDERRVLRRWEFDRFPTRRSPLVQSVNAVARRIVAAVAPPRRADDFAGLQVAAGSQWTALTSECVADLLRPSLERDRAASLLRHSLAPDEIYFHTRVHSSEWSHDARTVPLELKAGRPTATFANLHYIDPSLSGLLTPADYRAMAEAADHWFARKFDARRDPELRPLVMAHTS